MHRTGSIDVALDRLAAMPLDGHSVLSLYLDLDPSRFPHLRDRRMQLDALLDDAERRYLSDELAHDQRMAVRADIERVRSLLTDDDDAELAVESGRGLAVFCSTPADMLEVVTLRGPVKGTVIIAQRPFIEPLVELEPHARWCALLVSRRSARILRGTRERLVEVSSSHDDVHQHHSQGGRSQARYQRGIEHEVDEHIRSTCVDLFERWQRRPFDRLALAAPAELRPRVEAELHAELRQRLAGHFEVEVEHATVDEIRRRAAELIDADERRHEEAALDELREGLAPGGHAAAGLDEVLELLNERRVRTLLLARGASDDILERAVELAREQSAEVLFVRHDAEELARHGPIAALLRY
jgi:peptide chain release factor subunit 1